MSCFRAGIDIGGTFTDFVLIDDSGTRMHLHKILTTPDDPARAAAEGFAELLRGAGVSAPSVERVVHGTTLVTNAIIERKGARTALLTTRGFRDTLEIGREQRYDIYDLSLTFPPALAARDVRFEVEERMSPEGDALVSLDEEGVLRAAAAMVAQEVEAVAICFLHAYRNPSHERRAAELIRKAHPQLSVTVSSDVAPEIGEFERFSTTVANAYVMPLMARYLKRLQAALAAQGFAGQLTVMQSSAGSATVEAASELPVRLLESGPAGGALAAALVGSRSGRRDLLSFDMGGTTAKACLIEDGEPSQAPVMEAARVQRFKRGSGLPIRTPVVDLIEIGAGGGSIARVDSLGLLKVGPESAGAAPGPACYGLGGTQPTVTDACLLLGYLGSDSFLGGRMRLDVDAAEQALSRLGDAIGLSPLAAADGIFRIVCENMAAAARAHLVERGKDPRRYAMVAFGGAGPAHAGRVARILGLPLVIVPRAAGAASALGFLSAPLSFTFATSLPRLLEETDWEAAETILQAMEDQGRHLLHGSGESEESIRLRRSADMRLLGQVHEITVRVSEGPLGPAAAAGLKSAFEAEYRRLYAHLPPGNPVEVRGWRTEVTGRTPPMPLSFESPASSLHAAGERACFFTEIGRTVMTPVYARAALPVGASIAGPAIVEEVESTTVVPPGAELSVDALGNLCIALNGRSL